MSLQVLHRVCSSRTVFDIVNFHSLNHFKFIEDRIIYLFICNLETRIHTELYTFSDYFS